MFLSAAPAYAADGGSGKETAAEYGIIKDEFEDLSRIKAHTGAVAAVTLEGAEYDGDTSGLFMGGAAKGTEILYEAPFEIGSYTLWLKGDTGEYTPDFKIYLSSDGKNFTWDKNAEHRNEGKLRIYTNPEVFEENRFLKIVYNGDKAPQDLYLLKTEIREEGFVQFSGRRIPRTEPSEFDYSSIPSLREAYKDYFQIGAALEYHDIVAEPNLLATQYAVIGSEGQTHFNGLQQSEGNFTWYWADRIFDWGAEQGMMGRLHALMYYINLPNWVKVQPGGGTVTKELFLKRYERHVKTVVSHYKGRVKYYDVVNELIDAGQYRPYMFEYKIFGGNEDEFEDFIANLFLWAYEADPDAKLVFLDGGLLAKQKRNRHWFELFGPNILPRILEKGVPKENIILGEQGHWGINDFVTEEQSGGTGNSLEGILNDVRELGLHVVFTEMDMGVTSDMYISDQTGQKTNLSRAENQELAAKKWGLIFDVLRENADIVDLVTFWGATDNTNVRTQTTGTCGTFFDYNFEPYPAFYRVLDFDKKLPRWTTDDITEINYGNGWTRRGAQAAYGTPVIDGKVDDVWKKTEKIELDRQTVGGADKGATGTLRVLWDEENIYGLFEVNDEDINTDNPNTWFKDCVEIFIGENNSQTGAYSSGDCQIRVTANGLKNGKGYGDWTTDWYDSAAVSDKKGYTVEIAYHMHTRKNAVGDTIGLDAQIVDHEDGNGTRRSIRKFCDTVKQTSETPECWGTCQLVEKVGSTVNKNSNGTGASGNAEKKRTLKNGEVEFSVGVTAADGTEYVSLKELAAQLGGTVRYDRVTDTVSLTVGTKTAGLCIGSQTAEIGGTTVGMGHAVTVADGRTAVPLKELLKAMDMNFSIE